MKKYNVTYACYNYLCDHSVTVEAENEDEAFIKAHSDLSGKYGHIEGIEAEEV